ncbi:MAG: peptidoglycan-binding protein [Clostridia bacterium]|nr:peptidoglycan-binding protein [Clostridia bacterium]
MPRRTLHRRMRAQGGCLSFVIGVLALAALALVAAIVITNRMGPTRDGQLPQATAGQDSGYVDANDPPVDEHQLVLTAGSFVESGGNIQVLTPSPTPSPEPSPTPEPTYNPDDPYGLVRPQPSAEGFLPIFRKANTEERMIAITVDECSGVAITTKFAKKAYDFGAKLTLFPTGENVMRRGMADVIRNCVYGMGFEIENRCYSGMAKLYAMNDLMMASEIWKQSIAVSYVLGVKYHPHFLRLYGGDGENDGRTHAYLAQNGYCGVAGWTFNGGSMDNGRIGLNIAPGNIYFFKTNENDLLKMELLMEEARNQGYEMVTLNKLFGYEENEMEETSNVLAENMPELEDTDIPYYFMKTGDCTWATNLLQQRLIELGYLPSGSADGVFGSTTAAALSAFQAKLGLAATGAADITTQERLFADDAPTVDE